VTKCDENVTSHHFVTVPHSNPGPGSGKIAARNDPQFRLGTTLRLEMVIGMQNEILIGIKKLPFYLSFQIFKRDLEE